MTASEPVGRVYCEACNGSGLVRDYRNLRYCCGWCDGYGECAPAVMEKYRETREKALGMEATGVHDDRWGYQ